MWRWQLLRPGFLWFGRGIVAAVVRLRLVGEGEGGGDPLLGGLPDVGLAVADGERGVVFGYGLRAVVLHIGDSAEIDVGPGEEARVLREANAFRGRLLRRRRRCR